MLFTEALGVLTSVGNWHVLMLKNVYQEHLSDDRYSLTVLAAIDDNVLEKRNRRHKQTVPTRKILVLSVTSCLYPTLATESPTFV